MAESAATERVEGLANALRKIAVFSDLRAEQLAWLAERFEQRRLAPGRVFVRTGDPTVWLTVVLEGEIGFQRDDDPDAPSFSARAGQVAGYMPYSRLTHFNGSGRAVIPTRLARLHRDNLPEMLQRIPEIGHRLVAIMADRIRETTRLETQRDKLTALGKLSAGLSHELNNPVSAPQRAAASLRVTRETVRAASIRLARHALSVEQCETIRDLEREAVQSRTVLFLDLLAQSDGEDRVAAWLEGHQALEA